MSEEMVIKHCSPTLAGLKTGSMFTCECGAGDMLEREIEALNSKLSDKGIRAMILRKKDGRALIYVFRPEALTKDFKDELTCSLLRERGYCCDDPGKCVGKLIKRLRHSSDFPHEIGLFLGFPPEDVMGFIEKGAKGCKLCGYWKVYGDEEKALALFSRFRKCTQIYREYFQKGYSLEKLTVIQNNS